MRLCYLFLFITTILLFSCKSNKTPVQTYDNDSVIFFQANDFLNQQVNTVNKTPYFIYKVSIKDNQTDSVPVSTQVFDSLAAIFTKYNISDKAIKKYYKESAFNDESTHSITLSYSTTNKELPVQSLDVLLNQETQLVKRIFMTIMENANDTSYLYKLSWKANDNFSIAKSITTGKGESITQTMVAWK